MQVSVEVYDTNHGVVVAHAQACQAQTPTQCHSVLTNNADPPFILLFES